MEEILIRLLLDDAAVNLLLGDRINWLVAPQGQKERPYAVLQVVGGRPDYHAQGASNLIESRVQIDAYGKTYESVRIAMDAIITAVSGRRGGPISAIFVTSQRDLPAADAGEVSRLFRKSADIIIHHRKDH